MDAIDRTLIGIPIINTDLSMCLLIFTHRNASDDMHDMIFINVAKQQLLFNFQMVYN